MEEKMESVMPATGAAGAGKIAIEELSKEEIINKYKGLLGIAKKAKQAKDELLEENRQLKGQLLKAKEAVSNSETQKEADKMALLTMKEMLEEFTENKLQMATQLSELHKKSKSDEETLGQLSIENESLRRQLDRLTEDNDSLLADIDRMEDQLNQVNLLGTEQKKHLGLLELEINKLKEAEILNASLQSQVALTLEEKNVIQQQQLATKQDLEELSEKYKHVKAVNSEQRKKFNGLKQRFVDLHRKLMQLKECKRILLETQKEYAEAISQWQNEIINASRLLCAQMNALKTENEKLQRKVDRQCVDKPDSTSENYIGVPDIHNRLNELQCLSEQVAQEQQEAYSLMLAAQEENKCLKVRLEEVTIKSAASSAESEDFKENIDELEQHKLESKRLAQALDNLKIKLKDNEETLQNLQQENVELKLISKRLEPKKEMLLIQQAETLHENKNEDILLCQLKQETERIEHLALDNESCHKNAQDQQLQVEKLNAEIHRLSNEITNFEFEHSKINEELQHIRNELKSMEIEKVELLKEMEQQQSQTSKAENQDATETLQNELISCRQSFDTLSSRYEQKEREHADLLGEMRELNEALKTRGDVISRQQEKQQELVGELKKTTNRLKQIEDKLNEKEQSIIAKDEQVRDINNEIDVQRNKVQELETVCSRHEDQVRALSEELQCLRSGGVSMDTQSDILSTSTISRAEELSRLRDVDESFEEKYNKLRGLAVKLKKKLQEQTALVSEMEQSGSNSLRRELEDCKIQNHDLQHQHEQSKKLIETLRTENQKLRSSRKQANVLNLEIEAAEKSLRDVTTKLSTKVSELEALNETLITKEATIVQLRKEIAILESAKEAECTHARELKQQIDRLQEQIKDVVHGKQSALLASRELEQSYESLKRELEEIRLQLAQSGSKHEVALAVVLAEKEQLLQELYRLKEMQETTHNSFKTTERTLEDLRVEYIEYKVKAQAVLRKNQNKDTSKERELEEELLAARTLEKQLQTTAATHSQRIAESDKELKLLREDNDSIQRRNQELLHLVEELRQQNDQLTAENRSQVLSQQTTLKLHRQQIDSIDACHKQQIHELELSYQRQIEQLKAETIRLPPIIGAASQPTRGANEQSKIDFLLMEREDAEGSEEAVEALASLAANRKISNASRRSAHDFMPLDELLNAPMKTISDTVVTTISGTSLGNERDDANETEKSYIELQATKERLQNTESRVRHLTALLAENEQDLAKLTQMNDMLKEELRRQERGVEREKHMHNSEYLKNVFLKFLTLNNGDERTRLVPVLNTILKLSRTEVELLNCVAKGQKVSTDANNRGWSNFLPSWGGNNN